MKWPFAALVPALSLAFAFPANADPLSLHGMWGQGGRSPASGSLSLFSGPSFLGAAPADLGSQRLMRPRTKPVQLADGGARPDIKADEPDVVSIADTAFADKYGPGSVVVDTARRKLYYVLARDLAYAYPIAVGKEGFTWTGTETVSKVVEWPEWMPPEEMRDRKPYLPIKMTGGVANPLGARAIYLGATLYRIHGTNDPRSIGSAASSGCLRMHNKHVAHLANLVTPKVTKVHVLARLPKATFAPQKPVKVRTAKAGAT
jgi:lipoprotein-anchoring transpeptidase ErfK/SrfK